MSGPIGIAVLMTFANPGLEGMQGEAPRGGLVAGKGHNQAGQRRAGDRRCLKDKWVMSACGILHSPRQRPLRSRLRR